MLSRTLVPRTRKAFVGAALLAICGAGVAVGRSGDSGGPFSPSRDRPVASDVQTEQARDFAVFARGRTEADVMPSEARAQVGNSRHSGRNTDLSRVISTPTGRGWAVPGNGAICLVIPDPVDGYGISCSDTDQAARHGLVAILVSPSQPKIAQVTMLSPRDSRVSVTTEDGGRRDLTADGDGVVTASIEDGVRINVQKGSNTASLDLPHLPGPTGKGVADCGDGVYVDEKAPCP